MEVSFFLPVIVTVTVAAEQSCEGRSRFQRRRQRFSWLGTGSERVLEASAEALDFTVVSRRSVPTVVIYCCIIEEKTTVSRVRF